MENFSNYIPNKKNTRDVMECTIILSGVLFVLFRFMTNEILITILLGIILTVLITFPIWTLRFRKDRKHIIQF